jgi:hypothetical protein
MSNGIRASARHWHGSRTASGRSGGRRMHKRIDARSGTAIIVACELPARLELRFSCLRIQEIRQAVIEKRVVEAIGATTLWEWLHEVGLVPGSFREIQSSWSTARESLLFTIEHGRVSRLLRMSLSSQPTKRRAFKRDVGNNPASLRARIGLVSSTSTNAKVHWRTWRL